ncbi:hypothetical protein KUTeg_012855 [Tegillarca granosa]|uniref:Uncharacterized protein n=1 Tax=Tegillarca granosa TaxID=220873 RepID=A0ABQ9EUF2_TEGGR|nr:hypothetical protein KUTeg_012855 [Tegillarca granosa]
MKRILIYTYIIFLCVKHINPEKNRSKKASAADSCFCKFLLDSRQKQYCIPENNFSPQYYLQLSSRLKEDVDLFLQEHFLVFMELQRETNDKLKRNFLLYSSSQLHGEVDDCSCKVESLDSLNNQKVYPRLQSILSKDYFKYFKEEVPFGIKETQENAQTHNKVFKDDSSEKICLHFLFL